ncbi:hypothetical protein GKO32_34670 [Amycolatopsis sp. RM579]|uniref:Uncharacterized protein n=1 Tax=Amycolatopsis pithecellobii TaxID=664692 RepID=A0A6N7ZBE5_9PSEU|nr:hypothetical protein [Amycolatopsis pithecellobii]
MSFPRPTEKAGPLAGHVRKGRTYRSPIVATGLLDLGDWVRDDLPDLLWPVLVFSELGTAEGIRFTRWQRRVQEQLTGEAEPQFIAEGLDGRLTSLDRLALRLPGAAATARSVAVELGLLPELVTRTLASYPSRPAEWLADQEFTPPTEDVLGLLARSVLEVVRDGHREAVIKCLPVWSEVQAGTFSTSAETIELLRSYPNDEANRAKADSVVRAMWGARKEALSLHDEGRFDQAVRWAKVFWGANSMTSRCRRKRELESVEPAVEDAVAGGSPGGTPDDESMPTTQAPEEGEHLRRLAMDLLSSYVEALETAPARLHDPERQEVHAGLVARVGRDVIAVLGAPDLWCLEHGAHIGRTLVEVRIYLQWMARQDPTIYRAYQDYGAGKAKLYAQIMKELPPDTHLSGFADAVAELEKLSHNDDVIDHRIVDTRDSFAGGKSIRSMAEECGLIDLYRQAYYISSGVAHSEWWSVETHAMERCLNILHGGHLIPSLGLNAGSDVQLASSWVDQLYSLMMISLEIIETDKTAVSKAFEWLKSEQTTETG